jgi:hypothetical protein
MRFMGCSSMEMDGLAMGESAASLLNGLIG